MSARQGKTASKPAAAAEPTAALWATLTIGGVAAIIRFVFPGHHSSLLMGTLAFQFIRVIGNLAERCREQPNRSLEYSLAINAVLLPMPGAYGLIGNDVPAWFMDIFLGGCILAVAAAVVDRAAKRENKRRSQSGTLSASPS